MQMAAAEFGKLHFALARLQSLPKIRLNSVVSRLSELMALVTPTVRPALD
jgi:hypothetical protein